MNVKTFGLTPASSGLGNIIEDFFNHSISDLMSADFINTRPSVNILEAADEYTIELAAPGLSKADFNVEVDKDQLIVSSELQEEKTKEADSFTKREFNYGSFKRSFHLSDKVDAEKIDALYSKGILKIHLPKKEEAKEKEPTVIEIS